MKKWYRSRTIWFNIITILVGMIEVITPLNILPIEMITLIGGIGNLCLRTITMEGIE